MSFELEVSLSACGGVPLDEALRELVDAGVRRVELAIGPRWTDCSLDALRRARREGVSFAGHHAFPCGGRARPFNLCDRIDVGAHERRMDLLAELGASRYSVHAGAYEPGHEAAAFERFVEGFGTLTELASARGVSVGIETMYPRRALGPRYLADDGPSVQALAQALPAVPWVPDLAHVGLWPKQTRAASLASLRALPLLEVHASDNDSVHDSHTAITERTWWLGAEGSLDPRAPRVLETRLFRPDASSVRRELLRVSALRVQLRLRCAC
ncbi:MAG: TIM barrel protein [Deltaproteobacteria bacterium]|nr:TIM barrel protein [Deltaproteobacteria bacterium]